ncbi:response regulator transcription factor [Bartonella sp. TP]|uniref:response regulator transcription factor n=1 Tax=Bartonella sp. TP TaxID=3057550 RepID=UPI0025B1FDC3|nr:response regulator transcription factor [Bartonella sp. TP]MDN5249550.1 response regulator transcription factor [Alphaproteobacteria bacterium]WJW79727.1 response regulator transcription factor [Bartonella sp. TP]
MNMYSVPVHNLSHILVIDDDTRIRQLLGQYLRQNNFLVSEACDAVEATHKLKRIIFDLLIVDIMMPGQTGIEFTQTLREQYDMPVLMLTALSTTKERILGLQAGADDYLAKPFEPQELVLRIQAILKRSKQLINTQQEVIEQIVFGPFTFFLNKKQLYKNGQLVRLTLTEQHILYSLAKNHSHIVSRQQLIEQNSSINERTIDVQVTRLRKKIELDHKNPIWIQTIRGLGYKLLLDVYAN